MEIGHQYVAHHTTLPGSAVSEGSGTDSVRVPLAARSPSPIRDRHDVLCAIAHPDASPEAFVFHATAGSGKTALAGVPFDEAVTQGLVGLWLNAATEVAFRAGTLERGSADVLSARSAACQPSHRGRAWHHLPP
ncbi:hypothetical protein AB0H18_06165 [Streptomyces sp. NPDC020766]|uniref:hypothetical protein n=1 Tax=Streptomyces sp. NPDC020766 TaxID=3155011 RepID=UPI0033CA98CB